jgi:hypothetical protein
MSAKAMRRSSASFAPATEGKFGIDPTRCDKTPATAGSRAPSYIDCRNGAAKIRTVVDGAALRRIVIPLSCSPFQVAGTNILLLPIERFKSTAVRQGRRHDHEDDG